MVASSSLMSLLCFFGIDDETSWKPRVGLHFGLRSSPRTMEVVQQIKARPMPTALGATPVVKWTDCVGVANRCIALSPEAWLPLGAVNEHLQQHGRGDESKLFGLEACRWSLAMEAWRCFRAGLAEQQTAPHLGRGCAPKFRMSPVLPQADLTMSPALSHHATWWAALEARLLEAIKALNDCTRGSFKRIVARACKLQLPVVNSSSASSRLEDLAWQRNVWQLGRKTKQQVFSMRKAAEVLAETNQQQWVFRKGKRWGEWIMVSLENGARAAHRFCRGERRAWR
jgi:hypothetical protein